MDDEPRAGIKLSPPLAADDLIRAAQRGDTLAMNDLLDLLSPYVARICGPIALDVAPDAAQEALIAIFRNLKRLREPAALRGWVRVIATREAVRMAKQRSALPIRDLATLPAPENSAGDVELAADIWTTLAQLTPEHRAVLVLRDLEGLDEAETATMLAVPRGTVKSRLARARQRFRKAWGR